ncbi:hypothetical protein D3C83_321040 [compost metagenome]
MSQLERQLEEAGVALRPAQAEDDARHGEVGVHDVGEHQPEEPQCCARTVARPVGGELQA